MSFIRKKKFRGSRVMLNEDIHAIEELNCSLSVLMICLWLVHVSLILLFDGRFIPKLNASLLVVRGKLWPRFECVFNTY